MKEVIALLVAWNLSKKENDYYISATHYNYLKFVTHKYQQVYLITTVSLKENTKNTECVSFSNIIVIELPFAKNYLSSQKQIFKYYSKIRFISKKVRLFYCRVPDPFSWMPTLIFRKKTIMHFVGDTIDATKYNEKWSKLKKTIMIAGYYPDYLLTLWAAKHSTVYTNGYHIAKQLKKYGINSEPVISSTISEKDIDSVLPDIKIHKQSIRLIYVGYIRFAKGMTCLMNLCKELSRRNVDFIFDVVGSGEMFDDLKNFISFNNLVDKVVLHGHVGNKAELFQRLREADLFFFPSLSEGSPRVVIEAMSQGIPVLSTPVGSLPTTFEDKKEIRFFDFNDYLAACEIIEEYRHNKLSFIHMRDNAYQKVKNNYTIEAFLGKIFSIR